jgi:alpha-ketoglutarate-dependent taurine dioxygenase
LLSLVENEARYQLEVKKVKKMINKDLANCLQVAEQFQSNYQSLDSKQLVSSVHIDLNKVTLKIGKVAEISQSEWQRIVDILNSFKFVILNCEPLTNPKENVIALKNFFGSLRRHHKNSDEYGIQAIKDINSAKDISNTHQIHPIHTDGTFYSEPPKVVALQCERPAQNGGFSQIVYAESVYEHFLEHYPQELQTLFSPGSFTITKDNQTSRESIFAEKEGRISVRFRYDKYVATEILPEVEKAFMIFKNYVNDPKNQIIFKLEAHQILIFDNTGLLHGRTSFPKGDVRKINKLWFEGDSEYAREIQFGFRPKSYLRISV